jgi:hypothetical protein
MFDLILTKKVCIRSILNFVSTALVLTVILGYPLSSSCPLSQIIESLACVCVCVCLYIYSFPLINIAVI